MKNILARIRKDLDTIKADLRDRAGIQYRQRRQRGLQRQRRAGRV